MNIFSFIGAALIGLISNLCFKLIIQENFIEACILFINYVIFVLISDYICKSSYKNNLFACHINDFWYSMLDYIKLNFKIMKF